MSTLIENVAKVEAAHAALKTALESKGVEVPENAKLSDMPALVEGIIKLENDSFSHLRLPKNIDMSERIIFNLASIKDAEDYSSLFGGVRIVDANQYIETVVFPTGFGQNATTLMRLFGGCENLRVVTFPTGFGQNATILSYLFGVASTTFRNTVMTSITLPPGFGVKGTSFFMMFKGLSALKTINFPQGFGSAVVHNSDSRIAFSRMFDNCESLEDINGELCANESLNLSYSPLLTHDSLMNVLNSIRTVSHSPTLTLGTTNLAKLTPDDKKVATDKGWTLA